jgi:hypothetical protein
MMRGLIPACIYLGIGALLHALFVGSHFDWSSAWTWGWLVAWPIMLGFWIVALALVVAIVIFAWEAVKGRL